VNEHELERLPSEVETILRSERARPEMPAALKADLFARIQSTVASLPDPGPESGGSTPGSGSPPPSSAGPSGLAAATGATAAAGLSAGTGGLKAAALAHPLITGVLVFALGNASGVGIHALAVRERAEVSAAFVAPLAANTPEPKAPPQEPLAKATGAQPQDALREVPPEKPAPPPTPRVRKDPPRKAVPPPPQAPAVETDRPDPTLGAERALLEMARASLARGNAKAALAHIEKHAMEHPLGALCEERDALWIQALVASGRRDEARVKAAEFRQLAPQSLFLPAVEAAMAEP